MRGIVLVSVMLNVFFISFLGIRYLQNRSPVCIDRRITINGLIASLPRADRSKFTNVLKQDTPRYRAQLQNVGMKREALDRAVLSPSFSIDSVQKSFDEWKTAWDDFISVFGRTFITASEQISPEGRRALVNAFPNKPRCH